MYTGEMSAVAHTHTNTHTNVHIRVKDPDQICIYRCTQIRISVKYALTDGHKYVYLCVHKYVHLCVHAKRGDLGERALGYRVEGLGF